VGTDVLEESIAFIIKVTRIGEQGTTLTVTSNWSTPLGRISDTPIKEMTFPPGTGTSNSRIYIPFRNHCSEMKHAKDEADTHLHSVPR
jgi:hypothetical protein